MVEEQGECGLGAGGDEDLFRPGGEAGAGVAVREEFAQVGQARRGDSGVDEEGGAAVDGPAEGGTVGVVRSGRDGEGEVEVGVGRSTAVEGPRGGAFLSLIRV
ncbi:hypothetical protein [Streptomyces resistomycificus]|uniref:hypothetical protein n=1 Tax=Streptomyces resistomycificus TaxID=67356 RepID=UPI001CECD28F|nr:hypothetical protein [Streptomyces resistomycificus]